jgi:hypothetical protein
LKLDYVNIQKLSGFIQGTSILLELYIMEEIRKHRSSSTWYRLQIRARKAFNQIPLQDQQKIYVLTLLIGAVGGLAAVVFHLLLDYFQDQFIYRAAAIPHWWHIPLVVFLPALGGLVTGAGLYFYAPEARGSGIPQVKVTRPGIFVPGEVRDNLTKEGQRDAPREV